MPKAVTVAQYIEQHPKWKQELSELRKLFLAYPLEETIKWGAPVYTLGGKNLFGLGAFKNHYVVWFFQGALLERNTALLVNTQEDKTHAMRQIKFEGDGIMDLKILSSYIEESISLHKRGKKIAPSAKKAIVIAEDLLAKFLEEKDFEKAFQNLTPGKQREYSDHISQAKRAETRLSRLKKIQPRVMAGKGLNDKYKNG